jgi:hypothetical protein
VLAQFGREGRGSGQLNCPCGIRLLTDGSGLVVADTANHRLCVFTLSGELVKVIEGGDGGFSVPVDVVECCTDGGSFVIANGGNSTLVCTNGDSTHMDVYGATNSDSGVLKGPCALAALPDGGLAVREYRGARLLVFKGLCLRFAWITVCIA